MPDIGISRGMTWILGIEAQPCGEIRKEDRKFAYTTQIHNPGPGSWLDKATAALAKGQPLPGANAFGTE
jgi:hypothetical protein